MCHQVPPPQICCDMEDRESTAADSRNKDLRARGRGVGGRDLGASSSFSSSDLNSDPTSAEREEALRLHVEHLG